MSLFKTTEEQKVRLYEIAILMKQYGLDARFVERAVKFAEIYEGAFDLFCLWAEESVEEERHKIVADLKFEVDEYKYRSKGNKFFSKEINTDWRRPK